MLTKSKIALIVIISILTYIDFNLSSWERGNLLGWDTTDYYLYLPATFIYHDIGKLRFYPDIVDKYQLNNGAQWSGIYDQPKGYKLNKYAIGSCIFEMPFFLIAHCYCINHLKDFPADGYSRPYLVAVVFSMLFWVCAGLFFLRKFLLQYFSEAATAVTLLLLVFATNLYFYIVFNVGMSHPFSFSLFCFLLYTTERWYTNGRVIHVLLLGLILGLIVIIRPTNIVVALIPLCWKYKDGILADKLFFLKQQLWPVIAALFIFFMVLMLQCAYWKYVTGHWVYYSYQGEGFQFLSPEIWKGLFSYRKGWFVYTPIALIGIMGLLLLATKYKWLSVIVFLYLTVNVYIVFSWSSWSYGGSFGCRALIESMAILSIPLAMLVQSILAQKKILITLSAFVVFSFSIALNVFQSYQLSVNTIAWEGTNKAFYWRSFGKLKVTQEDRKLLEQE